MYIEPRGKSLIIRWTIDCQRYHICLANHNSPVGKASAQMKLATIEKDILSGHFDPTLLKYKPRKSGKNPTEITAVELFGKYIDYRRKEGLLSHSSIGRLEAIVSKLGQLLGDKLAEKVTTVTAKAAIAKWSESASSQSIKTYLGYLKLCWDWAKGKYHAADLNPWVECLDKVRSRGNTGQSRQQVKPFTIAELQAIIATFKVHPHYSHYTEFIVFLSNSACRFGEAAGLRWKHLGEDYTTAWIGESISRGHQNKKGTKTGKSRIVQLSPSVRSMLVERFDRLKPQPEQKRIKPIPFESQTVPRSNSGIMLRRICDPESSYELNRYVRQHQRIPRRFARRHPHGQSPITRSSAEFYLVQRTNRQTDCQYLPIFPHRRNSDD
jgi:integrase